MELGLAIHDNSARKGFWHIARHQQMIKHKRQPYVLYEGNVLDAYDSWDRPNLIISDGAYGIRGFDGDTSNPNELVEWYRPHIEAWSRAAHPSTALWFWNTELGWASVHPLFNLMGWDYVQTVVWDKGLSHIAGNVNGNTIRQYPVVTEIAVLYRRRIMLPTDKEELLPVKQWIRYEWERSGLPLYKANEACGVKNAATRKYLTKDHLWYWPPGEAVEAMAKFAGRYGAPALRPYFSLDGRTLVTAEKWDALRSSWHHRNGLTNVWTRPPLADSERFKGNMRKSAPRAKKTTKFSAVHLNQKPIEFMERQIYAASDPGDVIWEPFGGLASASVAAVRMGRCPYAAEMNPEFQTIARERLADAYSQVIEEESHAKSTALFS